MCALQGIFAAGCALLLSTQHSRQRIKTFVDGLWRRTGTEVVPYRPMGGPGGCEAGLSMALTDDVA